MSEAHDRAVEKAAQQLADLFDFPNPDILVPAAVQAYLAAMKAEEWNPTFNPVDGYTEAALIARDRANACARERDRHKAKGQNDMAATEQCAHLEAQHIADLIDQRSVEVQAARKRAARSAAPSPTEPEE